MNRSLLRLTAALVLLLLLSACASATGAQWTFSPVAVVEEGQATDADGQAEESSITEDIAGEVDEDLPTGADPVTDGTTPAPPPEDVASAAPDAGASAAPDDAASAAPGEARIIELDATGDLRFKQGDEIVADIPVTPGETVTFQVDNVAGFDHNFYIGTEEELAVANGTTDVGIPTWQTGVQELTWQVPDDISGLKFGCTVPGHYALMQGTFSVAS